MMLRGVYEVLEAASSRAFGEVHIDGGRCDCMAHSACPTCPPPPLLSHFKVIACTINSTLNIKRTSFASSSFTSCQRCRARVCMMENSVRREEMAMCTPTVPRGEVSDGGAQKGITHFRLNPIAASLLHTSITVCRKIRPGIWVDKELNSSLINSPPDFPLNSLRPQGLQQRSALS
jgi:hypothetical protein